MSSSKREQKTVINNQEELDTFCKNEAEARVDLTFILGHNYSKSNFATPLHSLPTYLIVFNRLQLIEVTFFSTPYNLAALQSSRSDKSNCKCSEVKILCDID